MLGVDVVIRAHNIQNKTLWGEGFVGLEHNQGETLVLTQVCVHT
jgi:hypothetical protein